MIGQLGPRAAEILNESHCKIEDQLLRSQQQAHVLHQFALQSVQTMQELAPHIDRYGRMEELLTDPNRLAAYTVDYFTHVQPLPERPNAAASLVRPDFPAMPPSGGGDGQLRLANIRPEQRWMVADQMEKQGLLQGKPIIVQ